MQMCFRDTIMKIKASQRLESYYYSEGTGITMCKSSFKLVGINILTFCFVERSVLSQEYARLFYRVYRLQLSHDSMQ